LCHLTLQKGLREWTLFSAAALGCIRQKGFACDDDDDDRELRNVASNKTKNVEEI
jgi:hypothetical protein